MNLPDRTVLDNGAVLIAQALPSNPFVAFRGSAPAGLAAEGRERGVAEFHAHLLLSGTKRMRAAALADRLEGIGATLEFRNSEEALVFQGRCTRETTHETLRILIDCLSHPAFPPREIERDNPALRHHEELLDFLAKIYGRKISLDDQVTVIHFSRIEEGPEGAFGGLTAPK